MDLTLSPTDGTAANRQIYPAILNLTPRLGDQLADVVGGELTQHGWVHVLLAGSRWVAPADRNQDQAEVAEMTVWLSPLSISRPSNQVLQRWSRIPRRGPRIAPTVPRRSHPDTL